MLIQDESLQKERVALMDPRLRAVLVFIHQHIAENLTRKELGAHFGFSQLIKGELSISEIAYEVGYNSISAFSNTFYSIMSHRPGDFQQLNRNVTTDKNE